MRYWWANQNQAYAREIAGGYLWSRQRRADGSRNPFYENLRLAQRGDIIFAYAHAAIRAVGVVLTPARESPAPLPPEAATSQSDLPGWLVDVAWLELKRPMAPADFMALLEPLLPAIHAPLTAAGKGIQGGRLLELPVQLALALLQLAGGSRPEQILNPAWLPHQLHFGFDNTAPAEPAMETHHP